MERFLWVCLGGALGSGLRYLVSGWMLRGFGTAFPWGTLTVNLLGSYLLASLMYMGLTTEVMSPAVRMALTVGVMGGFTTYSTFSYETMRYLQEGAWDLASLNVVVTVVGCLAASLLGYATGRWLTQA